MTAVEKSNIYTLLRTSAIWLNGYIPSNYKTIPTFEDDCASIIVSEESNGQPKQQHFTNSNIDNIIEKIRSCKNCPLSKTRINTVPGEGVLTPTVMVIGEGPGEEEDKTGRPFVGPAGQLLDKMLSAIQLSRTTNCFIANIVKCRPPANRTPFPQEAESCSGYLQAQIHILKPKMILAMGRTAIQNLLHTEQGINTLRGKLLDYNGIPLLATYHPSALLRNPDLKRPAWNDLKVAKKKLLELCPDYATSFKNGV